MLHVGTLKPHKAHKNADTIPLERSIKNQSSVLVTRKDVCSSVRRT